MRLLTRIWLLKDMHLSKGTRKAKCVSKAEELYISQRSMSGNLNAKVGRAFGLISAEAEMKGYCHWNILWTSGLQMWGRKGWREGVVPRGSMA